MPERKNPFKKHIFLFLGEKSVQSNLSLLDAHLNLDYNVTDLEKDLQAITAWDTIESRPWINWNLQTTLPLSNAAIALQMLLPGTINLNHNLNNSLNIGNMTSLRALAVPIHMNGNYRRCDCDSVTTKEINYVIHEPIAETIQLGMVSNKMTEVTIFGHKSFKQKFHHKIRYFHEIFLTFFNIDSYWEINC